MDMKKRHKFFGTTAEEWLKLMTNELESDAIGLWQIVPVGKYDFELDLSDLEEFTRSSLNMLMLKGAVPVKGKDGLWVLEGKYGKNSEEIINNIISTWINTASPDPDVGDVWFTLPQFVAKNRTDSF